MSLAVCWSILMLPPGLCSSVRLLNWSGRPSRASRFKWATFMLMYLDASEVTNYVRRCGSDMERKKHRQLHIGGNALCCVFELMR